MADVTFRPATRDDVPAIVASPDQALVVADRDGQVVGTAQITFMAGLSHRGMVRAEIEAVRVHSGERGAGLGTRLIRWCIE